MQITLKLYATLGEYLPAGTVKHSIALDISDMETAHTVLERCHVPKEKAHLVLLNGVYLTPEQRDQPTFKEGDAQSLGLTQHVGVLRGLIQTRIKLGKWKQHLMKDPTRIMEAYLGCTQAIGHNAGII